MSHCRFDDLWSAAANDGASCPIGLTGDRSGQSQRVARVHHVNPRAERRKRHWCVDGVTARSIGDAGGGCTTVQRQRATRTLIDRERLRRIVKRQRTDRVIAIERHGAVGGDRRSTTTETGKLASAIR